jgi:hypothetical protein
MKRFISLVMVATLLVGGGGAASSVAVEDEQIPSPHSSGQGRHGIEMNEVAGLRDNVSVLISGDSRLCSSVDDSACGASSSLSFRAVLGPCTPTVTVDCIETVTAKRAGNAETGSFSRYFPNRGVTDFVGSPRMGIPDGVAPGLWEFPSVPHAFGSTYQVTVLIAGSSSNGDALAPSRSFFANITPVSIYQTNCNVQFNGHCMDTYYEDSVGGRPTVRFAGVAADQDGGFRCQNWGENSQCALKHAFPDDVNFELRVRLRKSPNGWLHGRMSDPTASIVETSPGVTTMTVSAMPVKVPVVAKSVDWSALPAAIQRFFESCSTCGTRLRDNDLSNPAVRNLVSTPAAHKTTSFDQLELWKSFINDSAHALPSVWNVRTLSEDEMESAPSCIRRGTGITGIVSTNATLYAEGPPEYDPAKGALNYRVSAPHFLKDGVTPFSGYYGLLLREDIAECLYGAPSFSSAAQLKVTSVDGTAKSSTTSFSRTDGWFRFVASGYLHSVPVISARLTPKWPTVRRTKKLSLTSVARLYGMAVPTRATVTATVSAGSKKYCRVGSSGSVTGVKTGRCALTISVRPRPTKKTPRPRTVRKTVTVMVK